MATIAETRASNGEPFVKRQRLEAPGSSLTPMMAPPFASIQPSRAAFPDPTSYIPVGSLRIYQKDSNISTALWESCQCWKMAVHPRDESDLKDPLHNLIQEKLLNSPAFKTYKALHTEGWIRIAFKSKDCNSGTLRIYILPDDVSRSAVPRDKIPQRKALQQILARIDVSSRGWMGEWDEESSVEQLGLSSKGTSQDDSLFHIFNTLLSPAPRPETVSDLYSREAMKALLDSDLDGLTTKMYLYQRRSAATMLQREAQPAQIIDPRLRPILDQRGDRWFYDFEASTCFREPRTYDTPKGGILAETMGLGKTLICLGLIIATREMSSQIPAEHSVGTIPVRKTTGSLREIAAANIGRNGTPWRRHFEDLRREGYDHSKCIETIKQNAGHYYLPSPPPQRTSRNPAVIPSRKIYLSTATLIVVPDNLLKQWETQIKEHTTGLKVLVMKNPPLKYRLPPAEELAGYDIILFSKQRFDKEASDGSDHLGRRKSTVPNGACTCQYIGASRERDCTCFKEEEVYSSPLKDIHFKRLIFDEGHGFGNASKSSQRAADVVVDYLQLTARWIVSGTPTQGLYGAEVSLSNSKESSTISTPLSTDTGESQLGTPVGKLGEDIVVLRDASEDSEFANQQENTFRKEERKDLEKLGRMAEIYLKARPWANTLAEGDLASWKEYMLQPCHGSKSRGNMDCLRSTLEGMIIRHRPEDYERDITLPQLTHRIVLLEGSFLDKLSLNTFSMMIVSNAVTSERRDADYLFHPRQRKALNELVMNLRQASFHWSGFTSDMVKGTLEVAKKFLDDKEVRVSDNDDKLLREAIHIGEAVLVNSIKTAISQWHEMPMYILNKLSKETREAWALDKHSSNPTLMGTTMVHACQKFVGAQLWKEDPTEGLKDAGQSTLETALRNANPPPTPKRVSTSKDTKLKKTSHPAPALAGGVHISTEGSSIKRSITEPRSPVKPRKLVTMRNILSESKSQASSKDPTVTFEEDGPETSAPKALNTAPGREQSESPVLKGVPKKLKSAMKKPRPLESPELDPSSPLASTSIVSTASAKLSYLIDQITTYQKSEKILVFYEAENVAYYIAQALEVLNIKHLIYARTLQSERKAAYVVNFNQHETFRVLLMDISQAAFGLDMSSASRVYFVNPVFSPMVEAQAVKRAHRIGQTKPVFVETLVLKGSIEEAILARRKSLTNEEHGKIKNILDDEQMYNWIRNVSFLPISEGDVRGEDQMALLEKSQLVFGEGFAKGSSIHDPDADLVLEASSPKRRKVVKM